MKRTMPHGLLVGLAVHACMMTIGCTCTHGRAQARYEGRPLYVRLPEHTKGSLPLVVFLHGYGGDIATTVPRLDFERLARIAPFVLAVPSGSVDRIGNRFWNAGACCDYFDQGVDDTRYLVGLIDHLKKKHAIDPRRVYVAGHSNGGHMAYRLACAAADRIAAVVVMAGAFFTKPACKPAARVSLLHVQGDADGIVPYGPATLPRPGNKTVAYPGAQASTRRWAARTGCSPKVTAKPPLRYGPRSIVRQQHAGCPAGISVQLWTVRDGWHTFDAFVGLSRRIWRWLLVHRGAH